MDEKKTKDLGILNYILLAAAVVHFILAIPATVLSFGFGVLVLIWSMILFLLAVLLPNFESFVKTVYVEKKPAAAEKPAPAPEKVEAAEEKPPVFVYKPLPESGSFNEKPVGRRYYYPKVEFDHAEDIPLLVRGEEIEFVPDGEDVELSADGVIIGKMRNNNLRKMVLDWQKKEVPVLAQVYSTEPLTMEIGFYSQRATQADYERLEIPSKEFRLAGVNASDYKYLACHAEVGEELDFIYDAYEDKYESYYGYLPKSANSFLNEEDTVGFVSFVDEDIDLKYLIKVKVYEERIWM